jgi:hypothetical protein
MNLASGEKLAEIVGYKSAALIRSYHERFETSVKSHEGCEFGCVDLQGSRGDGSRHIMGGVESTIRRASVHTADVACVAVEDARK